jgi:hypothetical protein
MQTTLELAVTAQLHKNGLIKGQAHEVQRLRDR